MATFRKPVTTAQGTLTLLGALDGVWSHTDSSVNGTAEGTRGRLSLGLTYDLGTSGSLSFAGFYDRLGASDYNARGLTASYVLRF